MLGILSRRGWGKIEWDAVRSSVLPLTDGVKMATGLGKVDSLEPTTPQRESALNAKLVAIIIFRAANRTHRAEI